MRTLWLALALVLAGSCSASPPDQIRKHCVSDTGQSEYFFKLEPGANFGVFRYLYMGQEVSYQSTWLTVDGDKIVGEAIFEDTASGVVQVTPVRFRYDWRTEEFNDGFADFICETLQDEGLLRQPVQAGSE